MARVPHRLVVGVHGFDRGRELFGAIGQVAFETRVGAVVGVVDHRAEIIK